MLKFGPRKYMTCYVSKVKLGKSNSMVLPPHQIYSFSTFFIRDISETVKLLMEFVIIMRTFQNNVNYVWDRPLAHRFSLCSHIHPHKSPIHGRKERTCPFFLIKAVSSSGIALCIFRATWRMLSQC